MTNLKDVINGTPEAQAGVQRALEKSAEDQEKVMRTRRK